MLIALNKPYGVICQFSEHSKHPTLKNYIDIANVYPAGRLDTDSEGLLLLTDDGRLQAQISNPKYKLSKTYWAQVDNIPTAAALASFAAGLNLGDFICQPAKIQSIPAPDLWSRNPPIRVRKNIPTSWLEIEITEGKNRQVRRMCAKIGYPCLRLIRVGIGNLRLQHLALASGEHCQIAPSDL